MDVIYQNGKFGRTEHLHGVKEIIAVRGMAKNHSPATWLHFKMEGRTERCLRSQCTIISIKQEV